MSDGQVAVGSTTISGNVVGLRKGWIFSGSARRLGNALGGIKLSGAQFVLIGNQIGSFSRNIVSANGGIGILIEGQNGSNNVVRDSIVGTDETGT